jgi:large subunit ribosomal protein L23
MSSIILKPIITEKMTQMGEKLNRYGFLVDRKANKLQIKKAIKDIYGVDALEINTMVTAGKSKTRYSKTGFISGKSATYKKAIITLAKGETIDFYSNI